MKRIEEDIDQNQLMTLQQACLAPEVPEVDAYIRRLLRLPQTRRVSQAVRKSILKEIIIAQENKRIYGWDARCDKEPEEPAPPLEGRAEKTKETPREPWRAGLRYRGN